jgi:demethylmenaquinone methyltransferase/2-methoxy-6-polyprenyl-1,4-benzoquinol methylase
VWPFATEVRVEDALAWDGPSGLADVIVSSFGLKTFDREQQRHLAERVAQILKIGGFLFVH